MCECRYYGKCGGNCDGNGLYCGFGNETYDCDSYKPMPDVDALINLANLCEEQAEFAAGVRPKNMLNFCQQSLLIVANRIRGAVGGEVK